MRYAVFVALWALWSLSIFISAQAQTSGVDVLAPPAPVRVEPVDLATLVFTVVNTGTATDTYELNVDLPPGLQAIGGLRPVTLDPGDRTPVFLTVLVPTGIPAGRIPIALRATSQTNPAVRASDTGFLEVPTVSHLVMLPPEERSADPGRTIELEFQLANRGNALDRFVLTATSRRGFPVDLSTKTLELLPGEERRVRLTLTVPQDAAAGEDRIALTARSIPFDAETSAGVRIAILPPSPEAVGGTLFLEVPTRIELAVVRNAPAGSMSFMETLSGNSSFGEASELRFHLQTVNLIDVRRVRFDLERERYGMTLGDVSLSLAKLIDFNARGARLTLKGEDRSSQVTWAAGAGTGLISGFQVGGGAALDLGVLVPTVGLLARPLDQEITTAAALRARIMGVSELAVEGAISQQPGVLDGALALWGRSRLPVWSMRGEFIRAGPQFTGKNRDEILMGITQSIDFRRIYLQSEVRYRRDNIASDPARPVSRESQARASARLSLAPLPTLSSRLSFRLKNQTLGPNTIADLQDLRLGFRLTQRVGPASLSLLHDREWILDLALGTSIEEALWGSDVAVRFDPWYALAKIQLTTRKDQIAQAVLARSLGYLVGTGLRTRNTDLFLSFERFPDRTAFAVRSQVTLGRLTFAIGGGVRQEGNAFQVVLRLSGALRFATPIPLIRTKGRVEGVVFIDENGNGVRDPGEAGVSEVFVHLGGQLARSGERGFFRFPPMRPGEYLLTVTELPLGVIASHPLPLTISLQAGEVRRIDLPLREIGALSGLVFRDENGNGELDPGEGGLAGVRVLLKGPVERVIQTGSDGRFSVQVPPGEYTVSVDGSTLPKRFKPNTPSEVTVRVETGSVASVRFGASEILMIKFAPSADFSMTSEAPHPGETVTFDASASSDPDGEIVRYEWDFDGDGSVDVTGATVSYVFEEPGEYSVVLIVTDDEGNQDSVAKVIVVKPEE